MAVFAKVLEIVVQNFNRKTDVEFNTLVSPCYKPLFFFNHLMADLIFSSFIKSLKLSPR